MRNAHFDMLPMGAFEHCGNGKIKLYGPVNAVTNFVGDVVSGVGNVISDAGSFINDNVIKPVVEHPLETLAAVTAVATMNPELLPSILGAETTTAAATDYLGSAALGDATTGAVGSGATGFGIGSGTSGIGLGAAVPASVGTAAAADALTGGVASDVAAAGNAVNAANATVDAIATEPWGLNPALPTTTTAPFGTFDPNVISAPGIDTAAAANVPYLGGASSLAPGTAGLTAEELAAAGGAASDAAAKSGLGYLGGADALPTGTAGITTTVPETNTLADTLTNKLTNTAINKTLGGLLGGTTTGLTPTQTGTNANTASTGALGSSAILDYTPHMTKGSQINLVGMPNFQETYTQTAPTGVAPSPQLQDVQFAADGGLIQHFEDGGSPVSLDPRFTKGRKPSPSTFYGNLFPLTSPQIGMPVFKAKDGGEVVDHQPQFYSEGGLGTLNNRYVKGPGDGTSDSVPAMLANGEFVIPADVVSKLGNGSNDAGASVLDKFLVSVRKHAQNHNPKKLPPDSKGPLAYLLEAKKKKA